MTATTILTYGVLSLIFCHGTYASLSRQEGCRLTDRGVYVAISSEAEYVDGHFLRWLNVNWFGISDVVDGDWIGLWNHDPASSLDGPLDHYPASTTDGSFRTEVRWDGSLMPADVSDGKDKCLPYFAGYVKGGVLAYSACLKIRPNWMHNLHHVLETQKLNKVSMPGNHDAGASGHFGLPILGDLVGRWTFTQDESLWQQLVLGSRYLDMRISYYNNTEEKFFVNHGDVRIAPLQGYLDQVANFMNQTQEIVIFDVHGLEGQFNINPGSKEDLMVFLESNFKQWMVKNTVGPNPTLGDIWTSGGRLVVTFPSAVGTEYFWPQVRHVWGDTNKLEDLEAFMYLQVPNNANAMDLWSTMAEFTPTPLDVTLNHWGGLRGAAAITNTPVTQWVRDDLWQQVSIVAMDFLPSSDIVSITIEANEARARCGNGAIWKSAREAKWAACRDTINNRVTAAAYMACADLGSGGGVGVRVWPTIQAAPKGPAPKLRFRQLQINWEAEEIYEGDWVGVFESDPRIPHGRPVPNASPVGRFRYWDMPLPLFWDKPYATKGLVTSNVTQPRPDVSTLAGGGCVGLWVGFIRNGACVDAQCITSHPRWLWDNKDVLGSRSLRSLMLPGTHNAGSYSLRDADDVVTAWVVCQDEDVVSQLLYGIRYLDLRLGYYPDTPELLWINHDMVRWRPLLEVLTQVRGFLALSPDPIVIDIHRMPVGFERPEAVDLLLSLINSTIGHECLSERYGPQVTLDQIWATGKRVIFSFADIDASEEVDWVWPPLPQAWANAQTLDSLRGYLDNQMARRASSPRVWAAMAHLTPTFWDLVLRSHVGVRGMSDRVNPVVTTWLQKRWAHLANIVASDFFNGNNIVNVAIRTNVALSVCPSGVHHSSQLRRSTTVRISEAPRRLSNPILDTIKNFEEDVPQTKSPASTLSPLIIKLTSTTPQYQRVTTTPPLVSSTPFYLELTTPSFQRVTTFTPLENEVNNDSSQVSETSVTSPSTTAPLTTEPDTSSFRSDVEPTASDSVDAPPDDLDYSLISPIQSILSLFGLNRTLTFPIPSQNSSQKDNISPNHEANNTASTAPVNQSENSALDQSPGNKPTKQQSFSPGTESPKPSNNNIWANSDYVGLNENNDADDQIQIIRLPTRHFTTLLPINN